MTSEWYRALKAETIAALGSAAARCANEECRFLAYENVVQVNRFDVREAAFCQAKVAGPDKFDPDIFTTFRTVALKACGGELAESASIVAAVSSAMKAARDEDRWLGRYLTEAPAAVRVQIASRAVTWLTRTLDLLDQPHFSGWQPNVAWEWSYPGRGLKLRAPTDLVVPGEGVPVYVVPGTDDGSKDEVAFGILVWCLHHRRLPSEARVAVHSTGRVHTVAPGDLLERGIVATQRTAEAVTRRSTGPDELARHPSYFTCQGCAWANDCGERLTATASRPAVRGGVRMSHVVSSGLQRSPSPTQGLQDRRPTGRHSHTL
jgi:hypothetical protein